MKYVEFTPEVWITNGREYAFGGDGASTFGPAGQLNGGLPISFGDLFQGGIGGPVTQGLISNQGGPGLDTDALFSLSREDPDEFTFDQETEPSEQLQKLGKVLELLSKLSPEEKEKVAAKGNKKGLSPSIGGGIPQTASPPAVLAQAKAARGIPPRKQPDLAQLAILRSLFR